MQYKLFALGDKPNEFKDFSKSLTPTEFAWVPKATLVSLGVGHAHGTTVEWECFALTSLVPDHRLVEVVIHPSITISLTHGLPIRKETLHYAARAENTLEGLIENIIEGMNSEAECAHRNGVRYLSTLTRVKLWYDEDTNAFNISPRYAAWGSLSDMGRTELASSDMGGLDIESYRKMAMEAFREVKLNDFALMSHVRQTFGVGRLISCTRNNSGSITMREVVDRGSAEIELTVNRKIDIHHNYNQWMFFVKIEGNDPNTLIAYLAPVNFH